MRGVRKKKSKREKVKRNEKGQKLTVRRNRWRVEMSEKDGKENWNKRCCVSRSEERE